MRNLQGFLPLPPSQALPPLPAVKAPIKKKPPPAKEEEVKEDLVREMRIIKDILRE